MTRGRQVQEMIDIARPHGDIVTGVGVLVDRSGGARPDFACPFLSLIQMTVEVFPADRIPAALRNLPSSQIWRPMKD